MPNLDVVVELLLDRGPLGLARHDGVVLRDGRDLVIQDDAAAWR